MKLLFLSKRHPQQRDLVERPYGRFFQLPRLLATSGHEVAVMLCSHKRMPSLKMDRDGILWTSLDIKTMGPSKILRVMGQEANAFRPDWIVACSDTWYGILARKLARATGAKLAIDAYDNYEAYMPWNLPLHYAWRRSIASADLVTAAGPQLASLLDRHRKGLRPTLVVPMAADPGFVRHDRASAREALGLPSDAPLVGYMGGWASNRGTDVLVDAFQRARARLPELRLVVTGRPPAAVLAEPGVLGLGYIPDADLPRALSAMDIAAVITANSSFGRYSYPAKLCEAMACAVPVVATATEPVRWMLGDDRRFLVPVGDATALADRILNLIAQPPTSPYGPLPSWESSARTLDAALLGEANGRSE